MESDIRRTLYQFAKPLILTGLLQQMYTLVDLLIVGNFMDSDGMASIGCAIPVNNFLAAIVNGMMFGCAILLSNYIGKNDEKAIGEIISSGIVLMICFMLVLTVTGLSCAKFLLELLKTEEVLLPMAVRYLRLLFAATPIVVLYNFEGTILKAFGDSRSLLHALVVTTVLNIVFDLLFVLAAQWGITGVALATNAAQSVAAIYLFWKLRRKFQNISYRFEFQKIRKKWIAAILKICVPTMIQYSVTSAIQMLMQGVANGLGILVVTAVSAAYRIDTFIIVPIRNGVQAVVVFVSNKVGEGKREDAQLGLKEGCKIFAVYAALASLLMVVLGKRALRIFGISEDAVLVGYNILIRSALFYVVMAGYETLLAYLQGYGDMIFCSCCSIGVLLVRYILACRFAPVIGSNMLSYAETTAWVVGALLCTLRYFARNKRKTEREREKVWIWKKK